MAHRHQLVSLLRTITSDALVRKASVKYPSYRQGEKEL